MIGARPGRARAATPWSSDHGALRVPVQIAAPLPQCGFNELLQKATSPQIIVVICGGILEG